MLKDIRMHLAADDDKQDMLEQQLSKDIVANHRLNTMAFSRYIPSLLPEVQNVTTENIAIFANQNGQYNIVDYGTGRTVYGLDPEAEISRQVKVFRRHAPYISLNSTASDVSDNDEVDIALSQLPG